MRLCSSIKAAGPQWPDQHANNWSLLAWAPPSALLFSAHTPRSAALTHTHTHSGAVWARHRGLGHLSEMAPLKWQRGPEKPTRESKKVSMSAVNKRNISTKICENPKQNWQKFCFVFFPRTKDLQTQPTHLTQWNHAKHKLLQVTSEVYLLQCILIRIATKTVWRKQPLPPNWWLYSLAVYS